MVIWLPVESFEFIIQILFFQDFFQSSFMFRVKLRGRHRDFPHTPCPHTCTASLIINTPHQSGTFVKINEPMLTHHYHPKSVVYVRIHSWGCTFYGFGRMYNDMHLSLQYHTEQFDCPKNPLRSFPPFLPATDLSTVSIVLPPIFLL